MCSVAKSRKQKVLEALAHFNDALVECEKVCSSDAGFQLEREQVIICLVLMRGGIEELTKDVEQMRDVADELVRGLG
jgi:hypothetical protein